jgi:CSLREA domain-containing protein
MNPMKRFLNHCLSLLLTLMLIAVWAGTGHALTFTVNSTTDAVAANPAGGVCETVAGNGICTLRAAIQVANAVGGPDTIILPAGTYTLTIAGTNEDLAANGDLDIRGPGGALTITGAGAATTIIDGGAIEGVFETIVVGGVGADVIISGVTIRNGNSTIGHGGGIHVGNTAVGTSVTLNDVVVTACKALGAIAGASGVDNSGTLNMNRVAVTNNDGPGGAVNNGAGVLTWNIGEVSGNINTDVVNVGGGGIQNKATMTLTNITISNNNSTGQGAGIDNDIAATATLLNVTLSGNISTSGVAAIGGIRNANVAIGAVLIRNTIISGNSVNNCLGLVNASQGNNLDSANSCLFAGAGDLINTDPLIGALALNGGALIKTRALLTLPVVSPAIDAGSATVCPPTDARGVLRPVDGNPVPPAVTAICDMGAYEFRPPTITVALPPTVTLPPLFDFGNVFTDAPRNNTVTLLNAGDGPLNIITVSAPLAPFSIAANNCLLPLAFGESCTVVERFAPTVAGPATGTFNITSNDPVNTTVPVALKGTGSLVPVPGIAVTDSITPNNDNSVPFGGVLIGGSADATITVSNPGTANLVIGTIASANPLAAPFTITSNTCSGATIAPAANCTLTVRFAPTGSAAASDTFDIPSNVSGTPSLTVSVTGTGGTSITTTTGNNPPPNPVLVSPTNGQIGLGTTVTLSWNKSADPDGDAVKYHITICTDQNLTAGCQAVEVAPAGLLVAGLGSMGSGIILFGFVAGGGLKRSRKLMLVIPALLLTGALLTACGGGGGTPTTPTGQASTTVTGLAANTTYFWKVVADDGKGGLATSDTFSFKTQ